MSTHNPTAAAIQSCANCQRYRRRIHELAAALDKERSERRWWEWERDRCQERARAALKRIYGRKWWTAHSWNDRHLIGLGLRALTNVGVNRIEFKVSNGWRQTLWKRTRHHVVMAAVVRPLRWLVGIPREGR